MAVVDSRQSIIVADLGKGQNSVMAFMKFNPLKEEGLTENAVARSRGSSACPVQREKHRGLSEQQAVQGMGQAYHFQIEYLLGLLR